MKVGVFILAFVVAASVTDANTFFKKKVMESRTVSDELRSELEDHIVKEVIPEICYPYEWDLERERNNCGTDGETVCNVYTRYTECVEELKDLFEEYSDGIFEKLEDKVGDCDEDLDIEGDEASECEQFRKGHCIYGKFYEVLLEDDEDECGYGDGGDDYEGGLTAKGFSGRTKSLVNKVHRKNNQKTLLKKFYRRKMFN